MMEKEQRNHKGEIRAIDENTISGYCVRFNEESLDMGFIETIEKGAITQEVIDKSDVFCLFNHDDDMVLGRSLHNKGNLKLSVDENGVKYECKLLDNELAKTVRSYIQAGLVDTSSFAFSIDPEDEKAQEWKRLPDGTITRTIRKIDRLYDSSPVWSAAYPSTTCSCRAFDEFKKAEEKRNAERKAEYDEYRQKINSL